MTFCFIQADSAVYMLRHYKKQKLVLLLMIAVFFPRLTNTQEEDPAPANQEQQEENQNAAENTTNFVLDGFSGVRWGTKYQDVKERFRTLSNNKDVEYPIEIIFDSKGKKLLVRRANIYYNYLFYKKTTPEKMKDKKIIDKQANNGEENEASKIARFFFTSSSFPFVPSKEIYNKLKAKYGAHTTSTSDKNKGAYVWDISEGIVVQWVEAYKDQPYTRSIYYISKEIREEIMKDLVEYQNYKELKAVENIVP